MSIKGLKDPITNEMFFFDDGTIIADLLVLQKYTISTTEEENNAELALRVLQKARDSKLNELNDSYNNAQYINVIDGYVFKVPLKGEVFKVDIKKQHDIAQHYGTANLIYIDIYGVPQTIPNIPKEQWSDFYVTANIISEANYATKLQYQLQILQAETINALNNILITFQDVQTYNLLH